MILSQRHRLFHYNTIMADNVLPDMGFNYTRPDGRVWFAEGLAEWARECPPDSQRAPGRIPGHSYILIK